jgi:hypothetical protein
MNKFYYHILNWSEVWPLVIPLAIFVFYGTTEKALRTIAIYIFLALILGFISTFISTYSYLFPEKWRNNGILYNAIAFLKVVILGKCIINLPQLKKFSYLNKIINTYIILTLTNFIFFQSPLDLSTHLFSATSIVLLIICLTYFLNAILDDEETTSISDPFFLICAGISIYEAVNFFIYLFLFHLYLTDKKFSGITIDIFHYSFIISYTLIAVAFYKKRGQKNNLPTLIPVAIPNEK